MSFMVMLVKLMVFKVKFDHENPRSRVFVVEFGLVKPSSWLISKFFLILRYVLIFNFDFLFNFWMIFGGGGSKFG